MDNTNVNTVNSNLTKFYINGQWVNPIHDKIFTTINPATAKPSGTIRMGSIDDVNAAVSAAKHAFATFSNTDVAYRRDLLEKIIALYEKRAQDLAVATTLEMGAPATLSIESQVAAGLDNLTDSLNALNNFQFTETHQHYHVIKESIGVCGLITPWNWPLNQISLKVGAAIATGCTMVLKPSEYSSFTAQIFAEIMDEAKVPNGVFNMIYGYGSDVGEAITSHPDIDYVSFTGSLFVGKSIVRNSVDTLKRITLELGGKSPNIITPDADLEKAVTAGVRSMMINSGQSCSAPSRMLVHSSNYAQAIEIAKNYASNLIVGNPHDPKTQMGPLVNHKQFEWVRNHIANGIKEGAKVVIGGLDSIDTLGEENKSGYFVKPTIFANVNNKMSIAREEIFGPVLCMIPYETLDEAIDIANDSIYGLAAYVYAKDMDTAYQIAKKLRAGNVFLNGNRMSYDAPFGGYKQSGIGRESGKYGLEEFLEIKAIMN
jgi:aldehyde dehydrogenase (NAD+)